ncbi:MAG: uracil-DNA glycosylase family protein [Candidatus Aminicenantia bacterium]
MKIEQLIDNIKEKLLFFSEMGGEGFFFSSPSENNFKELKALEREITNCRKCRLFSSRTNLVFGQGNSDADLMFIGEAPGEDEDRVGEPFVGKAGQLLTKIIKAMNLTRADVYITNVVKCRPPSNRNPREDEIKQCWPYLIRQINLIRPKIIVALGKIAAQALLDDKSPISYLRGNFYQFQNIKVIPTYHPAYLVRNESNTELKRKVWHDMKKVMAFLNQ